MASKLTVALTKKEAETYCAQGLHREALTLYEALLSNTPNISDTLKANIRNRVLKIVEEMEQADLDPHQKLSAEEIGKLRADWCGNPTEADLLICGHAFLQIGCYGEALDEFKTLLGMGHPLDSLLAPVTQCLACLHGPEDLATAFGRIAKDTGCTRFSDGLVLAAAVRLLEEKGFYAHALALSVSAPWENAVEAKQGELRERLMCRIEADAAVSAEVEAEDVRAIDQGRGERPDGTAVAAATKAPGAEVPQELQKGSMPPSPGTWSFFRDAVKRIAFWFVRRGLFSKSGLF